MVSKHIVAVSSPSERFPESVDTFVKPRSPDVGPAPSMSSMKTCTHQQPQMRSAKRPQMHQSTSSLQGSVISTARTRSLPSVGSSTSTEMLASSVPGPTSDPGVRNPVMRGKL